MKQLNMMTDKKHGLQKLPISPDQKKSDMSKMMLGSRELKKYKNPLCFNTEYVTLGDQYKMNEEDELITLNILYGEKPTRDEINQLSKEDRTKFFLVINKACNSLSGYDRDQLYNQLSEFLDAKQKRDYWDNNHFRILMAIDSLTINMKMFPPRSEIVEKTGLSRTTVNKHLKDYHGSDGFKEKKEEYILLRERLLARVYGYAVSGDMRAAKIFIEATAHLVKEPKKPFIKNQHNNLTYINGALPQQKDSFK